MHHCIIYFYWVDDTLKVDTHVRATTFPPLGRRTTFHNTHPLTHYQNRRIITHPLILYKDHYHHTITSSCYLTLTPPHHLTLTPLHHLAPNTTTPHHLTLNTTTPPHPQHHHTTPPHPHTTTCTLTNLTDEQCHDEHSQEIIEHGEGVLWCVGGIRKVVVDGCQRQQRPVETPDVAKDNNSTTDQRTYNAVIFKQTVSSKYPPHSSLVLPLSAATLIKASTPHSAAPLTYSPSAIAAVHPLGAAEPLEL